MPVQTDSFRQALSRFASGVTVVTVAEGDKLAGLTVSAFSSVSLAPPYVLVCVDKQASTTKWLTTAGAFAVNVLASNQIPLSNRFASQQENKFEGVSFFKGSLGCPILEGTLAYLECSQIQTVDAGDHIIYIGQVEFAHVDSEKEPLLYYSGHYRTLADSN